MNRIDPNGMDYYQSTSGAVVWRDESSHELTIDDEIYRNIGRSYSMQMEDGRYANFYQDQLISTSKEAVDAGKTILDNPMLAGSLLRNNSRLSENSKTGLMADMIRQAQGDFVKGSADFWGTILEASGNALAVAGYAVSATGVGTGVGLMMSGLGNGMARIGTGVRFLVNLNEENYGQAVITLVNFLLNTGTNKIANFGSMGRESIEGGVNLFFTPINIMIGNLEYNKKK